MHLPSLLRDVRRLRALSVRAAAARCDVPRATWAGWEAGTTTPSVGRLNEVLRSLGYDLRLDARQQEPRGEAAVHRFLRKSLTTRTRTALADQLPTVLLTCRQEPRLLTGPAAIGVWVPHVVARGPLPLPPRGSDEGLVRVRLDLDGGAPSYAWVPPPAQLILSGQAQTWPSLLTAHRLLSDGPRDTAERRLPPHRDADERRERLDLLQTLTWGARSFFPVSETDSRSWRLDAPASLDELLEWKRLPPRHPRPD